MEKYGVETKRDGTTASPQCEVETCPLCGLELEKVDGVYLQKCPTHGTKPFEVTQ
jgi:hypothetical protein